MNNMAEAIALLREEMDKRLDVEHEAASFLTNTFLNTYSHEGDEEDPTPSLISDLPLDTVQRVVLIVAGCALAFQQVSEEAFDEAKEEDPTLDTDRWDAYLDGVTTLTSGLMGLALAVADSATAAGELTVEDILRGAGDDEQGSGPE